MKFDLPMTRPKYPELVSSRMVDLSEDDREFVQRDMTNHDRNLWARAGYPVRDVRKKFSLAGRLGLL